VACSSTAGSRWIAGDQTLGFGSAYDGSLRLLATGKPCTLAELAVGVGALASTWGAWARIAARRAGEARDAGASRLALPAGLAVTALGALAWAFDPWALGEVRAPMPFLILLVVALGAAVLLNGTVWGRHLQALGRNETAARYSGIDVRRVVLLSYAVLGPCRRRRRAVRSRHQFDPARGARELLRALRDRRCRARRLQPAAGEDRSSAS
jgi:ABC-type xylose transport system permease subunit